MTPRLAAVIVAGPMPVSEDYRPDPRHPELGPDFYDPVAPARFPMHVLRHRNQRWAERVGLGGLDDDEWIARFGRFEPLPENLPQPLALRYHGHQFRNYNPDLGDGRGFLFAQLRDGDGRLLDLATKGSGPTPWSRAGDGRLTLKGGVREVLATALLEARGVYTSKSFSLIETGEALERGDEPSPTRSSVLVRLGHSHVRFGTFQRQLCLERPDNLRRLVDYAVATYFPEFQDASPEERPAALLRVVVANSAKLVASWMAAGFVHGVLNTDNLCITGESFDYGPYRFLPTLDPGFTAAYFDHSGLYAFGRQPEAVGWNLARLAETLLELTEKDALVAALETFDAEFRRSYVAALLARLGIEPVAASPTADGEPPLESRELVDALNGFMAESRVGFEQCLFDWHGGLASRERAARSPEAEKYQGEAFEAWQSTLAKHREAVPGSLDQPYFKKWMPCDLLIDEIEELWGDIADGDDWSAFEAKLEQIEEARGALGLSVHA